MLLVRGNDLYLTPVWEGGLGRVAGSATAGLFDASLRENVAKHLSLSGKAGWEWETTYERLSLTNHL